MPKLSKGFEDYEYECPKLWHVLECDKIYCGECGKIQKKATSNRNYRIGNGWQK